MVDTVSLQISILGNVNLQEYHLLFNLGTGYGTWSATEMWIHSQNLTNYHSIFIQNSSKHTSKCPNDQMTLEQKQLFHSWTQYSLYMVMFDSHDIQPPRIPPSIIENITTKFQIGLWDHIGDTV